MAKVTKRTRKQIFAVTPAMVQARELKARLARQVRLHRDIRRLSGKLASEKSKADAALLVTAMSICQAGGYEVIPQDQIKRTHQVLAEQRAVLALQEAELEEYRAERTAREEASAAGVV